ncbi:MAG TPA: S4 domain-containing protein [Povalibacter sp.]
MREESERLHKLLAHHGLGSRREVEKWMLAGRVLLNGRPAQPGDRFKEGDRVSVDGQDVTARLRAAGKAAVLLYHKPQGQPVQAQADAAAETAIEQTVMERLPVVRGSRWLVINTMQPGDSGLLVLTSDGRLADALRRRSERIPSTYVARVLVPTPEFDPASLPRTVQFNDQTVAFESIESAGGEGTNRWFRVEASHSHLRAAVRALFEIQGLKVSRVIQLKYAGMELPRGLPRGKHQPLPEHLVDRLYELAGLTKPVPEMRRTRAPRVAADRQRKPAKRSVRSAEPAEKYERGETRSAGASRPRKSTGKKRSGR